MSRVIPGLVALCLFSPAVAAHAQTVVIQGPDGAVGWETIQASPPFPVPPSRDVPPAKTGTSRIRGRVVAADNGEALRRSNVRLTSPEIREGRATLTDDQGRYEFADLPAGRYSVSAGKNGYVTISFGQRRPNEPGRPLELADKQIAEKVDFILPRGGVIVGRVLDEYGEPVANAMVQPVMIRVINGERKPSPSGPVSTTPDTGEFRLWGLQPGDYLVLVNSRMMSNPLEQTDDRSSYAPSYYPGTPNVAEAQPITLAIGQTASGVDIQLRATRSARLSGTTQTSKGQPLRGGMVMVMPRSPAGGMMLGGMQNGMIRPDGTFVISGVMPGEYTLRANAPPSAPGATPEFLTASVTVAGDDVSGIILTATPPIRITGRITLDPPSNWLQPDLVRVMATPKTTAGAFFGPGGMPVVNDDFTFEIQANPGTMVIRAVPVAFTPGGEPWSVKSVRVDTTDIVDSGIDLAPGRDLSNVEIVLTNRVQTVSGLVTNARGEIAADVTVLLFAQDPEQREAARFSAVARPDQNGRYSIRTLPPGEYFAVALDYLDQNRRAGDPAYLDDLSRDAVRLTLGDGETRTLDLKMAPSR
jgi:protocatechuate 3,4-dioxygenase beta subunit